MHSVACGLGGTGRVRGFTAEKGTYEREERRGLENRTSKYSNTDFD